MHCPQCGQRQASEELRFCTKCGLAMGEVKQLLLTEQQEITRANKDKIRSGVRQGAALMIFGFVLVAILAILRDLNLVPPIFIKIATLLFCIGGAVRMGYAFFATGRQPYKKVDPVPVNGEPFQPFLKSDSNDRALPTAKNSALLDFNLPVLTTKELIQSPSSVTEHTTKSLKNEL